MSPIKIIEERLKSYQLETAESEQDALKEILQEIILYGLSTNDFFDYAAFQGGTALRIFYNLPRFSEDLDFILKKPDKSFKWQPFCDAIESACKEYGVLPEVVDKSKADIAVKKMFLKDNSIGKLLKLSFSHDPNVKLNIKLEIGTNPPLGSEFEIKHHAFPILFPASLQTLSSNFGSKCCALLWRPYVKGRDWFDFLWYINKKITPNFIVIRNGGNQCGHTIPEKELSTWTINALRKKINEIDWEKAQKDVYPFLSTRDKNTLSLWGAPLFLEWLNKLESLINLK